MKRSHTRMNVRARPQCVTETVHSREFPAERRLMRADQQADPEGMSFFLQVILGIIVGGVVAGLTMAYMYASLRMSEA